MLALLYSGALPGGALGDALPKLAPKGGGGPRCCSSCFDALPEPPPPLPLPFDASDEFCTGVSS